MNMVKNIPLQNPSLYIKLINKLFFLKASYSEKKIPWNITCSIFYLMIPFVVFSLNYFVLPLSSAILMYSLFLTYQLVSNTEGPTFELDIKYVSVFIFVFILLIFSGLIGPLYQNEDWLKHYAILNTLVEHEWPLKYVMIFPPFDELYLKYSIGWYVIPALFSKLFGSGWGRELLAIWSGIGMFLFFSIISRFYIRQIHFIVFSIIFITFSGFDILGISYTDFYVGSFDFFHLEWWSSWAQYSSHITSFLWTPQHAIPAWLAVAILFHQIKFKITNSALINVHFFVFVSILFWSPFAAIGLICLYISYFFVYGIKNIFLNPHAYFSFLFLFMPVALFLLNGSADIVNGFVFFDNNGCVSAIKESGLCFGFLNYLLFIFVEFLFLAVLIVVMRGFRIKDILLYLAIISLLVFPLYRFGEFSDLTMRSSIPSLAILSFYLADTIICNKNKNKNKKRFLLFIPLFFGAPTWIAEVWRGFNLINEKQKTSLINTDIGQLIYMYPELVNQYFSKESHYLFKENHSKKTLPFLTAIDLDLDFSSTYGNAEFNLISLKVDSKEYSDSAIISEHISLEKGFYQVKLNVSYDLESNNKKHAAHFSIHGKMPIIKIFPSKNRLNEEFIGVFYTDGSPINFSFGVGGWNVGKGFIMLHDIEFMHVTKALN